MKMTAMFVLMWAGLGLMGCAAGGTVERRITIATEPPGALVFVNDVEMGRSPVTFPFLWYGDYDIRLRLERNEGTAEKPKMVQYFLHTHKKAEAPPFQWLGIDLFAELSPVPFKDEKTWAFLIPPVPQPSLEQLVQDAKALQGEMDKPAALAPEKEAAAQAGTKP